jgi:hypothetical protein
MLRREPRHVECVAYASAAVILNNFMETTTPGAVPFVLTVECTPPTHQPLVSTGGRSASTRRGAVWDVLVVDGHVADRAGARVHVVKKSGKPSTLLAVCPPRGNIWPATDLASATSDIRPQAWPSIL